MLISNVSEIFIVFLYCSISSSACSFVRLLVTDITLLFIFFIELSYHFIQYEPNGELLFALTQKIFL